MSLYSGSREHYTDCERDDALEDMDREPLRRLNADPDTPRLAYRGYTKWFREVEIKSIRTQSCRNPKVLNILQWLLSVALRLENRWFFLVRDITNLIFPYELERN